MTRDQLNDVSITSANEFEAVLAEAVENAIEADVDVRGAWEFRTRGSTYDWEVEITELHRDLDDEVE
jgi:3-keto-L-gulonate-6-phosphate decarboxylase